MTASAKSRVVIVGGGSAALEAAFRLQRLAGDAVQTTILAPDDHFTTRAMAVLVPFAAGHVPRESLARMASDAGAALVRDRMASLDPATHRVVTEHGGVLEYDALLIAVGGVQHSPYRYGLAFGAPGTEEAMHGLVQDLEAGAARRVAFVVPPEATWPVPLYELALMTVERAYDQCQPCEAIVVTHEPAPLALFGPEASRVAPTGSRKPASSCSRLSAPTCHVPG
jgi:sulfide:quinone oxidoreductase